ncbi:hypothetical protein [Leifsonia xyli]|uniref:hypothetical protein n=1 Tax=Leifsonia xyli TaxID=1575 RepID=UPI001185B553|nr:hypothetical protein [Leifsonia xyli]
MVVAVVGVSAGVVSGAQASPVRHSVAGDQSGSDQQDSDEFSFDPPGTVTGEAVDTTGIPASLFHGVGDALISSKVGGSVLTTFGTGEGAQTVIRVPSAGAPREYRFRLGLPEGIKAVGFRDGGVAFVDGEASVVGALRPPWAIDARGATVRSFFRVNGQEIVLTLVGVTSDTVFPVVAGFDEAVQEDVDHSQPIGDPNT